MTGGQIAGLIAAVAFVVLVVYLARTLVQTAKLLQELQETMKETTKMVEILSKNTDEIMDQSTKLVDKTNTLMDDVNSKSSKLNPLFDTVENLGKKSAAATSEHHNSGFSLQNLLTLGNVATVLKTATKVWPRKKNN
ncbi:methyl-accepting chemotaxis-like protein [Companilactobacillus paralimentarius DSM 13238 = JCM 10415]|uniref:DUF948 domain-containing protein n=3 Tax=Companilactobacillus TaxID=2767879 RepID=A0A202FEJ0_9LACO|nr:MULTISPECIES: DUF948 domain-containing protein [Companilactobacillus]KAE9557201.1 chemotaxis protein [Companilactobacillus bobalius]KAE9563047.1 chemotaxis protein [Companilactobacillus paralimentarius]KRK82132.1 methyl-accepting chemotaxis-like protein [Companilactobacillus bobalius DSM 19674]KRL31857.1 methyl-accepting chemotaxis-like protein [Companilactobacillus paralimentarius DSM 13238 = JCM 10415]MDR4933420.1 DUF948 domain-containing protein [Companilactobacillus paralimentarius]